MKDNSKIKRRLLALISSRMIYNGYVVRAAIKWKSEVIEDFFKNNGSSILFKLKSYYYGYLPNQVKTLNITKYNRKENISYKQYLYLYGVNGKYNKWLADIVTTDKILKNYRKNLVEVYYQLYLRDGKVKIVSLRENLKDDKESFYELIKSKKSVILMSSDYTSKDLLEYKNNKFFMNGKESSIEKIDNYIKRNAKNVTSLVLREKVKPNKSLLLNGKEAKLFLKVYNKNGLEPLIGEIYAEVNGKYIIDNEFNVEATNDEQVLENDDDQNHKSINLDKNKKSRIYFNASDGKFKICTTKNGKKITKSEKMPNNDKLIALVEKNFDKINELIKSIFKTIPQIEMAGVELTITDKEIKIINIFNNPEYCTAVPFDKDFNNFLIYKYNHKRDLYKNTKFKLKIFKKKVWLKLCKLFAKTCYPKGLVPYISFRWLRDMKDDFIENKNIPIRTKLWAYRHGFLSYRLAQYNITKDNYKNFISDFEYKWLRHINNYYKIWFEDKITIKYIASDYNKFFPKYYYYISLKQGENQIIPMMDCPRGYGNTYDDIINLVKKEKDIALKRDKGSHGEGFYRLSYKDNKLYLNLKEATREDVIDILSDKTNEYLVTEYIKQHDVLNKIYDGSVNTIRIIVFKKDGKTPIIGNAYMRFGSKKTGTVDNIGAGGIFVSLDEETGFFHDALIITDDLKIVPCKEHPDTHLPIEGYIPNWDKVVKDILEIAESLKQIEYFGFDIAITEDGMKFPEINRYPDYMKIGRLKPHSIEYLLGKVEEKKKKYGYDKRMPHKLFKFIDRREK
ncbi:MAG: sugar-transfer associated ATP-grasp domain-containing protein [Bacilli bacterium]